MIQQLMEMGFERPTAAAAIRRFGNFNMALQ
jgi:hypothetical protein